MINFDPAALGALNCTYLSLLLVGFMYALLILIGGADGLDVGLDLPGDMDFGGVDLHGEVDLVSISPVTIAGFVTAFGAFGLIALGLQGATGTESLVWATFGGLIVGVVSHIAFYYVFIKPQGSSEVTRSDLVGATAEVITPIAEGGVGEIAVVAQGARFTMPARSSGGIFARGTLVTIREVVGSLALVGPVADAGGQAVGQAGPVADESDRTVAGDGQAAEPADQDGEGSATAS